MERDCEHALGDRVREAAREGGLVVVTGAPLSGKTRTVWAALTANLPETTRVFAPSPGTDLRGLAAVVRGRGEAGCVLWLDDLGGHLGDHGLTPAVLADLVRLRVPVLATMEDEAYDARRFGTADRARVLDGTRPVELNRVWSDSEWARLEALDDEPRLRSARLWRGAHTVPEYLAVGSDLVEEWRRASRPTRHPRGHLLVRAAADLYRCGVPHAAISDSVLRGAQKLYPDAYAAAEAIPYLEQAAEAGIVRSQFALGMLLTERAKSWMNRAAEAGHPLAARALPRLHAVTYTPPDTVKE
ncbi:hypothetical protein [Streptomyces cyaneofuscatus]|uniref:hypothetical protein n=1 Tax=Streptomyces cyaneofuscatus TaxID=66883 RepID=UPI0033BA0F85